MLYPDFAELIKLQTASTNGLGGYRLSAVSKAIGNYNSLFRGQGMEFDSVRPYIPGDDIRHIDWRVTARIHKPHVKTFQAESDRKIILVIDSNSYMRFGTRGTFKSIQAARAAAIIAGVGLQNRDRVGALVFGDIKKQTAFFPPSRVTANLASFFKLLCQPAVDNDTVLTLSAALEQLQPNLAHGNLVFLITDIAAILAVNVKLLAAIKAKSDLVLLPIIDPIDLTLPALEQLNCANNVDQTIKLPATTIAMRNKYQELAQLEQKHLHSIIKKYQLKLINLYTNQPVHQSINTGLQKLRYY